MLFYQWLIQTDSALVEWPVADIAKGFKKFYIDHPKYLHDYSEMARSPDPSNFPLKTVERQIRSMPLNFMSNKEKDYFVLDRENDIFSLKPEIQRWWHNRKFRNLILDRITFALARYFYRKYDL